MTTRKLVRRVVTLYVLIPIVIVFALATCSNLVWGHHASNHKVLVLGEESTVVVSMSACDTEEHVKKLLDMAENGIEAFRALYQIFMRTPNEKGEPTCGIITDTLYPFELLYEARIGNHPVWVFRFMDSEGDIYVGFSGVPVVPKGQGI